MEKGIKSNNGLHDGLFYFKINTKLHIHITGLLRKHCTVEKTFHKENFAFFGMKQKQFQVVACSLSSIYTYSTMYIYKTQEITSLE